MHAAQRDVEHFHRTFGLVVGESPAVREGELRARLLLEEAIETAVALVGSYRASDLVGEHLSALRARNLSGEDTPPDLAEAVDGVCDTIFIAYGTVVALGIDLEPFWDEVVRANLAKLGGGVRSDGKILKPAGWRPPKIQEMLEKLQDRGGTDLRATDDALR